MGVAYNDSQSYIHSCSSDKKCCLTKINYTSNVIEIPESQYGYTALEYDKHNTRLFLTNEGGCVSVFNVNAWPPSLFTIIQIHTINTIGGLHVDYRMLYIFTAINKGDILVLNLGQPGKEKLISENFELITGD